MQNINNKKTIKFKIMLWGGYYYKWYKLKLSNLSEILTLLKLKNIKPKNM